MGKPVWFYLAVVLTAFKGLWEQYEGHSDHAIIAAINRDLSAGGFRKQG